MEIHRGAVAPYSLRMTYSSAQIEGEDYFDLTIAESAVYEVRRENGDVSTWDATVVESTDTEGGSEVTIEHVYETDDLPLIASLSFVAAITLESGDVVRTKPELLNVVEGF